MAEPWLTTCGARTLWNNFGAEEAFDDDDVPTPPQRVLLVLASLADHFESMWFPLMSDVWPWMDDVTGLMPWLSTPAAARLAHARGLVLGGPAPEVVRLVHDKAFAVRTARTYRLVDEELSEQLVVLEPHALTADHLRAVLQARPAAHNADVTLKPRMGTSGRGRVRIRGGVVDEAVIAGLAQLQRRGGAVLEPWLARVLDLSALWHIDDDGVTLLGTTQALVSAGGVYGATRVQVDAQGHMCAGTSWDHELVVRTEPVVQRMLEVGFRGPCGVDALVYVDAQGHERLRAVVEVNARYTAGLLALAAAYRHGARPGDVVMFRPGSPRVLEVGAGL
jgi:hypothetical protein